MPASSRTRTRSVGFAAFVACVVVTVMAGLALVSCGAERPVLAPVNPNLRATTTTAPALLPTSAASALPTTAVPVRQLVPSTTTMQGLIATPIGAPVVHKSPKTTAPRILVPRVSSLGVATVFAVVGDDSAAWVQVLLPTRPNGSTGWVERTKVKITQTDVQVFVDLTHRNITVKRAGRTVLQTTVAVGTPTNPTPKGMTYITELLDTGKPNGQYGPYAFGLGLHSDTLSEFAGGNGQVGIHGTNEPALIGQAVSHGCVRLNNRDLLRLVGQHLALGTPVFIR